MVTQCSSNPYCHLEERLENIKTVATVISVMLLFFSASFQSFLNFFVAGSFYFFFSDIAKLCNNIEEAIYSPEIQKHMNLSHANTIDALTKDTLTFHFLIKACPLHLSFDRVISWIS